MRSLLFKCAATALLAFSLMSLRSSYPENVINGDLSFLLGDYDFVHNDDGSGNVKTTADYSSKYSLKITKSHLILLKDGKKALKYPFSSVKLDLLKDGTYVMFMKDGEYFPMFYKDNKVSVHIYPEMYIDNYYLKTN
jgi:hypothetical protein